MRTFADVEGRATVVGSDEIKAAGWTLSVSRYVLSDLGEEVAPLPVAVAALKQALAGYSDSEDRLRRILGEGGWLT